MRVRAYDKEANTYFKSDVYAIINEGWYSRYLVLIPGNNGGNFKLIDYFDKSKADHPININVITHEPDAEWVKKQGVALLKVRRFLLLERGETKLDSFFGYPWVFEEAALLARLIGGEALQYEDTPFLIKETRIEGWNSIETQEDILRLYQAFYGFHDSCLTDLTYISGARVLENGSMIPTDDLRQVTMRFDSQWTKPIELVFEGVLALYLSPAQDNRTSIVYSASVILKDETVFFCDGDLETEDLEYGDTWIKALGLRWRQRQSD